MSFRYNPVQRTLKKIYRKFFPVKISSWEEERVKNICSINLVPSEKLKPFFGNMIKKLQSIKGEEIGDYFEFGVFNGSSMSSMYLAAKKRNLKSMRFFGFDGFQGLPEGAEKEDDGAWKEGAYVCSFEKMKECLKRKKINPENINWVKGWYKDTLNNKTIKKFKLKKIGIVFIDSDTYHSSKTVLDFIGPLLTEEAILCLDNWKHGNLDLKGMGEYRSFNEFLEKNTHLEAKEIKSYNRKSKTFLIKPRRL